MRTSILLFVTVFVTVLSLRSQTGSGTLSGSFSSTIHIYNDDNVLNLLAPQDPFASNNYLWLQYRNGPFTAGLQYEAYMPPLQGFAYQYEGNYISHRFLSFKKGFIDITAGNFYEQFGSGLSFRAYEERALGLNNSIDGVRVRLNPAKFLYVKGIYGKSRRFNDYADAYLRGIDGEIRIDKIFKSDNTYIIGGGFVSRYEPYTGPDSNFPSTVNAINTRISLSIGKISLYSEYVHKSKDPDALNLFTEDIGKAFTINTSFSGKGFGVYLASRYLNNMNFQAQRLVTDSYTNINYLPSNSRQYTYLLSNLYPYSTQAEAELSLQADLSYKISSGTDIRFNYAIAGGVDTDSSEENLISYMAKNKYYGDLNFEISRKWNRNIRSKLAYQQILYNKGVIEGGDNELIKSRILISDLLFRLTRTLSVRAELQHLWTKDDHGNWIAMLAELNMAPNWSLFLSDMTDYQFNEQAHYFNGGLSYSNNYFRINIAYGRNREGFICSGGVCRLIPAYKGINIGITSSF